MRRQLPLLPTYLVDHKLHIVGNERCHPCHAVNQRPYFRGAFLVASCVCLTGRDCATSAHAGRHLRKSHVGARDPAADWVYHSAISGVANSITAAWPM